MTEKKIVKLSDKMASLIAAGEVISRPASVVKELVENSIDSGASVIDLWIENGGKSTISVRDNGCGMGYNNLQVCIEKYSTSKIYPDFSNIVTFGFRGEALSSVAAVSKLKISSRHLDNSNAYCLYCGANQNKKIESIVFDYGTQIDVRDLFCTLPARLKFLKSDKVESEHCLQILKKFAISNPDITFSCYVDQKKIFNTKAAEHSNIQDQLKQKLTDIFGKQFIENTIFLDNKNDHIRVYGFVGSPVYTRSSRDMQIFFVNKRFVKDPLLHAILKVAYADLMASDKNSVAVLFIEIDNYLIDVNVHPAKTEIRFRDAYELRSFLVNSIKSVLTKQNHHFNRTYDFVHNTVDNQKQYINNCKNQFPTRDSSNSNVAYSNFREDNLQAALFNSAPSIDNQSINDVNDDTYNQFPLGAAVAQVDKTFILSVANDAIFVIDQHAVHERIVYENLKNQMQEKKFLIKQKLLEPVEVKLDSVEQYQIFENYANELLKLGIVYDLLDNLVIKVVEFPSIIAHKDIHSLVQRIANDYTENIGNQSIVDVVDYILKTIACHNSIRANRKLSISEMNELLRQIENDPTTKQCNHGRPTYIKFTFKQIGKWFDR